MNNTSLLIEDQLYKIRTDDTVRIQAGKYQINLSVDVRGQVTMKTYFADANEEVDKPLVEYRFDLPDQD